MPSTNISLYLESIRSSKAPFYCPFQNCGKHFRKIELLRMHLNNVDHVEMSPNRKITPGPSRDYPEKRRTYSNTSTSRYCINDTGNYFKNKNKKFIQFKYNNQLEKLPADTLMKVEFVSTPKKNDNGEVNLEKKSRNRINKNKKTSIKGLNLEEQLPEPAYRKITDYPAEDKEPADISSPYYRYIVDSSYEEEDQSNVEYDMDEEDSVWLELINKKRRQDRLLDVNVETFELIMDRFEKESFFQSQHCGTNTNPTIDEDAVCSICSDGECQNSNAILFCDMCNIAVHQECYGVPYIPEGLWLCRRCIRSPSKAVDCVLCPNKGGAFKHTDDNRWAHVICALWIPEVGFSNSVFLEPVDSINAIPAARWKLTCSICHQKNVGACIQCYKHNCYVAFHVTCAQQAELYMKIEAVRELTEQGRLVMNIKKTAYCLNHAPVSKNGYSNGLYLSDEDSKSENGRKNKLKDKLKNARKILADKRTNNAIVSIPTLPNEKLSKISQLVSFPRRNEFLVRLYAYWKLKRQSRNGISLLRRLQYTNPIMRFDFNIEKSKRDSLKLRMEYEKLSGLRRDLERVRLLLELIRKRERMKLRYSREYRTYILSKLTPYKMFLMDILEKAFEKDTNKFFHEPVDVKDVPDYYHFITNPMDLSTIKEKIDNNLYSSFDNFTKDLYLIVDNCTYYNDKDTIWYKAAIKFKNSMDHILEEYKPYLVHYNQKTGLLNEDISNPGHQ